MPAATARRKAVIVLDLVRAWAALASRGAVAFVAERTYFWKHAARMPYDQTAAADSLRGSGAVERVTRPVVSMRVKQAGLRWTAAGVAGVLALRALLRSEDRNQW